MKRILYIITLLLITLSINSCDENYIIPKIDTDDSYIGDFRDILIGIQTQTFEHKEYICSIKTPSGEVIKRRGYHYKHSDTATLKFDVGLKSGKYKLLALATPTTKGEDNIEYWKEFGLGFDIEINERGIVRVLTSYDPVMELSGKGTFDDPYIVTSSDHLYKIRKKVNNGDSNHLIKNNTYFRQECDIDLDYESFACDHQYGWIPIGNNTTTPFKGVYDGNGYKLSNLWCNRDNSAGIGLFGFSQGAAIKRVILEKAKIKGYMYVGGILGSTIVSGERVTPSTILQECEILYSSIETKRDGLTAFVGGIAGGSDIYSNVLIDGCKVDKSSSIKGDYFVGGIIGGNSSVSTTRVNRSINRANIEGNFASIGGIVGAGDSIIVVSCQNYGNIVGAIMYKDGVEDTNGYGVGGIVGGARSAVLQAVYNEGNVTGWQGVGGIIGGTKVEIPGQYDPPTAFGDCYINIAQNKGSITAETEVGGICGAAQLGCTNCFNDGSVSATGNTNVKIGGIVGQSSVAAIEASVNRGEISATNNCHAAGGLIGLASWGSIIGGENYGAVNCNAEYSGGIIGLAGNYTTLNFCCNYGHVKNSFGGAKVGGLIGEVGDPREWSTNDIFSILLGTTEIVMAGVGAAVAVTGSVSVKTGAHKVEHISHAIHKVHTAIDIALLITDAAYTLYHVIVPHHHNELEQSQRECEEEVKMFEDEIKAQIKSARESYNSKSSNFSLQSGLNPNTMVDFAKNFGAVMDDFNTSEQRQDNFISRMNEVRIERAEYEEECNEKEENNHKIATGVLLFLGAVATIAGIIATEGAALAIGLFGAAVGIASGLNLITESTRNFKNNVVIISQSANAGKIEAPNGSYVGGLIGYFHQTCQMYDSFNIGECISSNGNTSGIIHKVSADSDISRCINYGKGWSNNLYNDIHPTASINDNYYYKVNSDGETIGGSTSLSKLCKEGALNNFDYSSTYARWYVAGKEGYFAIPFKSQMQEESTLKIAE